ncbi:oxidoreductase [Sporosarcina sp. P12(2017)]|uniref:NADPH:quinone oxidoreductase family protein n=1 Tax=unclassified Sporosarcina TaxID=2647733 RepID=UPI000C16BBA1|nr:MULTISPECIES: acryloyl-CoA reductase [unclassified Sporosarcina]PIC57439.1 oxidoreductase [Sporosarcina sp. P10]PIC60821.1 oxidoreductase [Sporosarcina sp. P12(2017)]
MNDLQFRALLVNKDENDFSSTITTLKVSDLPAGDVIIKVGYSSINYKDGLAATPNGKIVNAYPHVPGIDMAGTVVSSTDSRFNEGDEVIATSYEIGVSHFGGFSEYARVSADWIVPLPDGLSMQEAMAFGTAGFTAALSIQRLEENGVTPDKGPVLVSGATGGVGSFAVSMLAKLGYHVVASTGKETEKEFLNDIGANEVISRQDLQPEKIRPLDKQLWAAAIDPVGGNTLSYIVSTLQYGGSVAVSGLTGGTNVPTTVFPFILRAVNVLGIDSVYCPMSTRSALWKRMATDMKPDNLDVLTTEVTLDELPTTLSKILEGQAKGRTVLKL